GKCRSSVRGARTVHTMAPQQVESRMPFSWKALALAPLPVPFIVGVLLGLLAADKNRILGFLFLFVLGAIVAYGATICLFLPCLFLVSRITPLTTRLMLALGTVLGGMLYLAELRIS